MDSDSHEKIWRNMNSLKYIIIVLVIIFGFVWSFSVLNTRQETVNNPEPKAEMKVPEDKTLYLTVPDMEKVKDLPVYNGSSDNKTLLDTSALHVDSTGFPWEKGSNVYIAGHRLGYEGTQSWLVFYDLETLEKGDLIYVEDTLNRRYTYRVYEEKIVGPKAVEEMNPVGKDVISLQTCTLPDYKDRYIVKAEKV